MKFDEDFDLGGFNREAVAAVVENAGRLFQEQIEENGILLCKMDKADIFEYETATGRKVLDAAKELILQHSKDGTLDSGLKVLAEKSSSHNGADYVGYLLVLGVREGIK